MLQRLSYFSRTVGGPIEMKHLVANAARKNHALGVTGLLLAQGDFFIQVLEGPRPRVSSLFLRIAQDARHTEVTLVEACGVLQASYPDWGMSLFGSIPKSAALWPASSGNFDPTQMTSRAISDFIRLATFELLPQQTANR